MPRLNKSLINKLEADRGCFDIYLREKYDISKDTWYEWKHKGVIDRSKGLKTLHTMLLDRLGEGQKVVTQIRKILHGMTYYEGVSVTTTTHKDKSGEIIETETTTAELPVNLALKAANLWSIYHTHEKWDE